MIEPKEIERRAEQEKIDVHLVFKEYLHLCILNFLFEKDAFSHIVFQGGTALRFVYGGVRYSEDLDFVLKEKSKTYFKNLSEILKDLPAYLNRLIPFVYDIKIKLQKSNLLFKRFVLSLRGEFLPGKDKTHIEFASVPSYDNQAVLLKREGVILMPAVVVESKEEILSDKFIAFAARKYLKGRDIWDVYFIMETLATEVSESILKMVKKKVYDYKLSMESFRARLKKNISLLKNNGEEILRREMERFLPLSYRKLFITRYRDICREEIKVLEKLVRDLK